jgi:hypothetical protein
MVIERIVKSRDVYKNNKEELCREAAGLPNNIYKNILRELVSDNQLSIDDKKKSKKVNQ